MPSKIAWPSIIARYDAAGPVSVEYSPEAVEKIRRLAFDGLMSLPRVGLGVGGFLLGTRGARKIEILGFHPIGCSHARGPSFLPTADEIAAAKSEMNGSAGAILGCYCSRPRRDLTLSDKDEALLRGLCPEPGQVALIIRPGATELSRAVLFYRKPDGSVAGGAEVALEPMELEPDPAPEPAGEDVEAPQAPEAPEAPPDPEPVRTRSLFGVPEPAALAPEPKRSRLPWRALGGAALAAGLLIAGFLTRDRWMPRPPLELRTAESNGRFFVEWNRAAVRGIDHGVLTVIDGPALKQIPLSASQLQEGALEFHRQTDQVAAVLDAGEARGSAKFAPPPLIPPDPAPPAPLPVPPDHAPNEPTPQASHP
jgi:hypothetical protein